MIFVSANGEVIGQFEESDLPSALAAGKFPADAHYWREGMPSWRPLRDLPLPPKPRAFSAEPKLRLSPPAGAPVLRRPFVPRPRPDAAPPGDAPVSSLPPVNPAPAVIRRTVLPGLKPGEEREKFPIPSAVPAIIVRRDAVPPPVPTEPAPPVAPAEEAPSPEAVPSRPGLTPFVPGQKTFTPRAKAVLPPDKEPEAPAAPVASVAPTAPATPAAPAASAAPAVGVARPLRTPPPVAAPAGAAPAAPVKVKATPPPAQRFLAADKPPGRLGSILRRALLIAALPLVASAGAAAWWFWPSSPPAPEVLEVEVLLPGPDGSPAAVAGAQVFVVAQEELATLWRARLESAPAVDPGLAESLERAKAVHREKELARELAVRISALGEEYNMPDAEQLRAESEAAQAAEAVALVELEKVTAESEAVSAPAAPVLSAPEGRRPETASDEAGRFTLPLPPAGQEEGMVALVLVAPGEGESEPRGWLVPLESAGPRTEAVRLSADNLLDLDQIRQISGLTAP
ncbi:MAG: DUF4339 domain-containing protein [Chthoniobacterales bacterium]